MINISRGPTNHKAHGLAKNMVHRCETHGFSCFQGPLVYTVVVLREGFDW